MKLRGLVSAVVLVLWWTASANAVSLTLQGQSGASLESSTSDSLYASDSEGESVLITAVGLPSPDGGVFTEMGVPSMMPDGRVLFGAETTPKEGKPHWGIYAGNPDVSPLHRVVRVVDPKPSKDCEPLINGDPYPVADAQGTIAFMSHLSDKNDALVVYSQGALTCLARSGSKTVQGHEIAVLSFGSPQMGEDGEIVFNAWLNYPPAKDDKTIPNGHRQALLIGSMKKGLTEIAVEGEYGPNRTRYMRPFGLPASLSSAQGTMVSFTARTPTGAALFFYSNGSMARILPTGTLTGIGPVTYLSPGRPGVMADGTLAVMAGCARTPAIFRLAHQHLEIRLQRGQLTPFGTELESLGDPVLTGSGSMFIGATDSDGNEKLYVLDVNDTFHEVGEADMIYKIAVIGSHRHAIFTGTLSVNQRGDFAYLGGK